MSADTCPTGGGCAIANPVPPVIRRAERLAREGRCPGCGLVPARCDECESVAIVGDQCADCGAYVSAPYPTDGGAP